MANIGKKAEEYADANCPKCKGEAWLRGVELCRCADDAIAKECELGSKRIVRFNKCLVNSKRRK